MVLFPAAVVVPPVLTPVVLKLPLVLVAPPQESIAAASPPLRQMAATARTMARPHDLPRKKVKANTLSSRNSEAEIGRKRDAQGSPGGLLSGLVGALPVAGKL